MIENPLEIRRCEVCGCSDLHACRTPAGPCHWVAWDLCSACEERALQDDASGRAILVVVGVVIVAFVAIGLVAGVMLALHVAEGLRHG